MIKYFMLMTLLSGCVEDNKTQDIEAKDYYNIKLLFEVDGIKVYRFYDKSHYRYFTNKGRVTSDINHSKNNYSNDSID